MKILHDVYEVWRKFSPYVHRMLITKEDFVEWAEKLEIHKFFHIRFFRSNTYLDKFLDFLIKDELLSPLKIARRNSTFFQRYQYENGIFFFVNKTREEIENDPTYKKEMTFFHPFQFFQFLSFLEYFDYIYGAGKYEEFLGSEDEKIKDSIKKMLLNNFRSKKWLNDTLLKAWIKLDSLYLYTDYLSSPEYRYVNISEVLELDEKNKFKNSEEDMVKLSDNYDQWREECLRDKESFLITQEKDEIESFYRRYLTRDFFNLHGLDKWEDIIDLIPNQKKRDIKGYLSFKLNIISIKRFFERIMWDLSEINLRNIHVNTGEKKPYFF